MSSGFHKRNTALYEEFQKKELHYLDLERNLSALMQLRKESSIPCQDYIHKINQRQRENEETYRKLMNQMDEMDKRTEILSFNLEKLNVLKDSIISSQPVTWTSIQNNFEDNLPFVPSISLNTGYCSESVNWNNQSIATQTENVYCTQCQFPLFQSVSKNGCELNPKMHLNQTGNEKYNSVLNGLPKTSFQQINEGVYSDVGLESSITMLAPDKQKEMILSSGSSKIDGSLPSNVINKNFEHEFPVSSEKVDVSSFSLINRDFGPRDLTNADLLQKASTIGISLPSDLTERNPESENQATKYDISHSKLFETEVSKVEDTHIDYEHTLPQTQFEKGDNESINQEFDFLESEKTNNFRSNFPTGSKEQPTIGDDQNLKNGNSIVNDVPSFVSVSQSVPQAKLNAEIMNYDVDIEQTVDGKSYHLDVNIDDMRSESSISAQGAQSPSLHSDPASVESDLDSFFDKETHLTDTAAYQALLGKIPVPERTERQTTIDSDSEDSVEKALSRAVRKSSTVAHDITSPGAPPKKEEKTETQVENEDKPRASKTVNRNKIQSEILKNRRKVLCFDSSGSEMEPEIKPVKKNIDDEDDDEFDF